MITLIFGLMIFNTIINLYILGYVVSNGTNIRRYFNYMITKLSIIYCELCRTIDNKERAEE